MTDLATRPVLNDGTLQEETYGFVATFCGDGRHHVRSLLSQLRQHAAEALYDPDFLRRMRIEAGSLKAFNIYLNQWLKGFNTTPAGGNYSADAKGYYQTVLALPGSRLVRHYLGQHETGECLAVRAKQRIERPEGVCLTLRDLQEVGMPGPVELFGFEVKTNGSRVSKIQLLARYEGVQGSPPQRTHS